MDYSGFRRSTNVIDDRDNSLSPLGQVVSSVKRSASDLWDDLRWTAQHPFTPFPRDPYGYPQYAASGSPSMTLAELMAQQANPFGAPMDGPSAGATDTAGPALAQGWSALRHLFPPTGNTSSAPAMPPTNGAAPTMPGQSAATAPPAPPPTPIQAAMAAPAAPAATPAPIGAPLNIQPQAQQAPQPAPANGYGSVAPAYSQPSPQPQGQGQQQNPGLINSFVNALRGGPNPQAAGTTQAPGILGGLQSTIGNIGNLFGFGAGGVSGAAIY